MKLILAQVTARVVQKIPSSATFFLLFEVTSLYPLTLLLLYYSQA